MPHTEPAVVVSSGMRRAAGDLYELTIAPPDASLSNVDLAPTRVEQRTWTTYNMASLWVGLSVCIPTYMLAAGLVRAGMSWWQAILTILLGNLIVLVPMVLIAHAGTRFGIPFPVLARAVVRHPRRQRARDPARAGRLRLVRHPDLDRRPGDPHHAAASPFPAWEPGAGRRSGFAFFAFWLLNIYIVVRGATRSSGWRPGRRRS